MMPRPSRAAAAVKATWVPWSSSGLSRPPRLLPTTSRDASAMRPANSGLSVSIPVSMIPIVTPVPKLPAAQAVMASCCEGPLERLYSAVRNDDVGEGLGVGVGVGVGLGDGAGIGLTPPLPPLPLHAVASAKVSIAEPKGHDFRTVSRLNMYSKSALRSHQWLGLSNRRIVTAPSLTGNFFASGSRASLPIIGWRYRRQQDQVYFAELP